MSEESDFLNGIRATPEDNTLRLIYADWLDEHGKPGGEFLRVECEMFSLPPPQPKDTLGQMEAGLKEFRIRLQRASEGIDPDWLAMVSRVPIERCHLSIQFKFQCPNRWESLKQTDDASVRFCGQCERNVFFCETIVEAKDHASRGNCVAVDPRLMRKPLELYESRHTPMDKIPYMGDLIFPAQQTSKRWWQFWRRT